MAFCELKYSSPSLQKMIACNLLLPETDSKGPFPVLYLLHGQSDDHTAWCRKSAIERHVSGNNLVVVMPDTGRGWYIDAEKGPKWESSIMVDLMGYIEKMFPVIPERKGRCIAGLSMGGYGAFKLALKFPYKFCAAVSLSGALGFGNFELAKANNSEWEREMQLIVGESPTDGPHDLYKLLKDLPIKQRPALAFNTGTEDFLLEQNRQMHAYLNDIGYPHIYEEHPGAHTWEYWDTHIVDALKFFSEHISF